MEKSTVRQSGQHKETAISARSHNTFIEKLKKTPLLRPKPRTGMHDGLSAGTSGIAGDHRFNNQRIPVDPLQRITL